MIERVCRLVLASGSPRRRELLALLGVPFDVVVSRVPEGRPKPDECPSDWAARLARKKAREVWRKLADPTAVVLGADTIVVATVDGRQVVLGKPVGPSEARRMLRALSGATHTVYTGLALITGPACEHHESGGSPGTGVVFCTITDMEIEAYLATGEPFDKAGAYGIQGGAAAFVQQVVGDYYNVVGLPLERVRDLLAPFFANMREVPPPPVFPANIG